MHARILASSRPPGRRLQPPCSGLDTPWTVSTYIKRQHKAGRFGRSPQYDPRDSSSRTTLSNYCAILLYIPVWWRKVFSGEFGLARVTDDAC
jgi:hypothetical protein